MSVVNRVLLHQRTKTSKPYVALLDDGRLKVGYWEDTAKVYGSAEDALARFKDAYSNSADATTGLICQTLESYIEQRDDGR